MSCTKRVPRRLIHSVTWCYDIFLISTYRPYLLLSILYLDIGRAPYFPYMAIAEPLSLLSLDTPPPVFLPI